MLNALTYKLLLLNFFEGFLLFLCSFVGFFAILILFIKHKESMNETTNINLEDIQNQNEEIINLFNNHKNQNNENEKKESRKGEQKPH